MIAATTRIASSPSRRRMMRACPKDPVKKALIGLMLWAAPPSSVAASSWM